MNKLLKLLFGNKYYLNIINDHQQDYIASTPFKTRKEAKEHRNSLEDNRSVYFVRTVSFRTKEPLITIPNKING